jgi:hypothetical protein
MDWPLLAAMLLLSFALTIVIQSVRALVWMAAEILRHATAHRIATRHLPIQLISSRRMPVKH